VGKKLMAGAAGTVKRVCIGCKMNQCDDVSEIILWLIIFSLNLSSYLWNLVAMHPA